jgi:hypothetical protein
MSNAHIKQMDSASSIQVSYTPLGAAPPAFNGGNFASAFMLGFAILFTPIIFISQLVRDTQYGYKRQLVVMGMRNVAYWLSCFATDLSFYLLISITAYVSMSYFCIYTKVAILGLQNLQI